MGMCWSYNNAYIYNKSLDLLWGAQTFAHDGILYVLTIPRLRKVLCHFKKMVLR